MSTTVYQKFGKRGIDVLFSFFGLGFLWPVFLLIATLIKLDSPGPVIFKQKRVGKEGKIFTLYKFRTMVLNAEKLKRKYLKLNEADGPVFKIKNDPRYTKIGKILSHTGLDESPQLFNILKGEISLVGPRPLPTEEEEKIPLRWQKARRKVKPGLVSSWLLKGAHTLSFPQWMESDLKDIKNGNFWYDLKIFLRTTLLGINLIRNELKRNNHFPF